VHNAKEFYTGYVLAWKDYPKNTAQGVKDFWANPIGSFKESNRQAEEWNDKYNKGGWKGPGFGWTCVLTGVCQIVVDAANGHWREAGYGTGGLTADMTIGAVGAILSGGVGAIGTVISRVAATVKRLKGAPNAPDAPKPDGAPAAPPAETPKREGGKVSSQVGERLAAARKVAENRGFEQFSELGGGVLWKNKADNLSLHNEKQVAKVKGLGFTRSDIEVIRDYYQEVARVSPKNPSAQYRADLMNYYLEKW
jgi:hypothetical protein